MSSTSGRIESVPLANTSRPTGTEPYPTLFEHLSADHTGIDFVYRWTPPPQYAHVIDSHIGAGVCIGDYDDDGLPDLYLARPFGGNRLYRNLGNLRFEEVTQQSGVDDQGSWGSGAAFADIDNDGDLDLYVCGYDCPNRLFINQGNGTFKEQAEALGLDFNGSSTMMAFADYDLDGDLDGYLLTYGLKPKYIARKFKVKLRNGRPFVPEEQQEQYDVLLRPDGSLHTIRAGQRDYLYKNLQRESGTSRFVDVSQEAGIAGNEMGLSATWWDFNHDGHPDLYVANDFWGADHLYRNNGDSTFTDVAPDALPHTPWYSMGSDVADINNDGKLDLLATDMAGTTHYKAKVSMGDMERDGWFLTYPEPRQYMRNALYLNSGTDRFMEVACLTGLDSTDWTWAVMFADLDNDGREDLFVTNGMSADWMNSDFRKKYDRLFEEAPTSSAPVDWDAFYQQPPLREPNLAYRNLGDLRFERIGEAWGLDDVGISLGAAMSDLDRDGDLDLVVNNLDEPVSIYRNRAANSNQPFHRILIRLKGKGSNRWGIGATVRIRTASGIQVKYLTLSRGFMSTSEPLTHVGMGQEQTIDQLAIEWPSGHVQKFEHLAADRFYTITEPDGPAPTRQAASIDPPLFRRLDDLTRFTHREQPFDDFAAQPLLPNKLSRLGPGLACGDVDSDGDEDFYIGGAAGQQGMLHLNQGDGTFSWGSFHPFYEDRPSEDMASLFFDADSDGDLDLYVVSGGVEVESGDERLRDRLYLNDGIGGFSKAPEGTLPDLGHSGSTVAAADFDGDGDLDLFVGGRVIPGQYPLMPHSRLLRNDQGRFTEVTDELAPGLRETGLVTSAIWSDADADGHIDLLITHEWGPIKLWHNEKGRLTDGTKAAKLAERRGWWNGIAARDVDNDGDMDYVVTNFGLNSKYNASPQRPALLYAGDFEGTGRIRLVEAEYDGDTLYPMRGKSCSQNAMPFVREKFGSFHDFALASISDIYTKDSLLDAQQLEANTLESGVLINDGTGSFTFRALPRLAQASPGFGVVLTEVDGDGHADLLIAQNFYSSQRETGRMDGGLSLLLLGKGDGTFKIVWPHRSGIVVPGDAKGLGAIDLNGDGRVDFLLTVNDAAPIAFIHSGSQDAKTLAVRLLGRPGNPTAVGARVRVHLPDGTSQTAEVHAGGSYLSQSSAVLIFGLKKSAGGAIIEVIWPDGQTSRTSLPDELAVLTIRQR